MNSQRTGLTATQAAVAASLRADVVSAEVGRAFETAGVRPILLKGPTLARLLTRLTVPRAWLWPTTAASVRGCPRERQPDAMARYRVTAIEVGEHEGSRIRVRHDHLRNQRRKEGQQ